MAIKLNLTIDLCNNVQDNFVQKKIFVDKIMFLRHYMFCLISHVYNPKISRKFSSQNAFTIRSWQNFYFILQSMAVAPRRRRRRCAPASAVSFLPRHRIKPA